MDNERFRRVKEIFDHAARLDSLRVSAFLDNACAGDTTLRKEVESLLQEDDSTSHFDWENKNLVSELANTTNDSVEPMVGRQIDAYVIERRIGEGGMGTVYLASRQKGYQQQVAIKLTKPGLTSDEVLRRFRREMQFLAALGRHPNIAGLMDGGSTDDGLHYLIMEYIDGVRIDRYCDEQRLSIRQRLELFLDVCAAVQFAHQNTVIHRDIKPSNILITSEGTAKLIDFGIAKLTSLELAEGDVEVTQTAFRALTPDYASPEQALGEPLTVATDIYSLGIVLYELLTGHRPYVIETTNPAAIAQKIRQQQPEVPSAAVVRSTTIVRGNVQETISPEGVSRRRNTSLPKLRREILGDLDNVVLMALRKEPGRRYQSIEKMAGDIQRHLHGLPVSARKDTLGYRFGKFVRRNRTVVAATALVVLSLIGGIVGTSTQWIRATQKAAEAKSEAEEKSEIFNFFVLDMLGAAHPNARAPDTTVVEVLGDAAETVKDRFGNRPKVAAVVHDTLGQSYLGLGDYQASREHLERSLEIRKTLGEDESAEALNTMTVLGDTLDCEGRFEEAESILRNAVELGTRLFGERHQFTLNAMTKLGETLQTRKKHDEAQLILTRAIELLSTESEPNNPTRQSAMNSLAASYSAQGDSEKAEPILKEVLAARRASGVKNPKLLNALESIGRSPLSTTRV